MKVMGESANQGDAICGRGVRKGSRSQFTIDEGIDGMRVRPGRCDDLEGLEGPVLDGDFFGVQGKCDGRNGDAQQDEAHVSGGDHGWQNRVVGEWNYPSLLLWVAA